MADNKSKIDRLHDLMPKGFHTKTNPNWNAILSALGEIDQQLADLVAEVRNQFFVKTASRPYLDRLAANNNISRPRLVGMDDTSFRQYIPVLSYQPKQVKLIIDALLDIFFFKESTTAYITTQNAEPYSLQDGFELNYIVDELNLEQITFNATDFTDITKASAEEIVSAINRQAQYSYAYSFYDSISKGTYVRIFTNTIGSKGSLRIQGGRANGALRLNGFIDSAGNGSNTQWTVSKIGDTVTFQHTAGTSPGLSNIQVGDIVIINLPGNIGSFPVTAVDIFNDEIQFTNLFATPGVYSQTDATQVKFIRPNKYAAYLNDKRAMTWETAPGEIEIEMPTSPPVVKRKLAGSTHINGAVALMQSRISDTSITLDNATEFPNAGDFFLEPLNEIDVRWLTGSENTLNAQQIGGRLQSTPQKYSYTSRTVLTTTGDIEVGSNQILNLASNVGLIIGQTIFMDGVRGDAVITDVSGSVVTMSVIATKTLNGAPVSFGGNTLIGISPALPVGASLNEQALTSLQRDGSNTATAVTTSAHTYQVGEHVIISGSSGATDTLNGTWEVSAVPTSTSFQFFSYGQSTGGPIGTPGSSRVERIALADSGSKVILTNSISSDTTRIKGAYIWDPAAAFVLSANTAPIQDAIQAGKIFRILNIGPNTIPNQEGFVMFDYGLNNQEGPVRYLYKPTATTLAIDPSYLFQFNHSIGSAVTSISHKGPHVISTNGAEFAPYITDPSQARIILEQLILTVKSAGIFVNFLVKFPEQLYGTLDVYNENGNGAGEPF